jgi:hypothetical protein
MTSKVYTSAAEAFANLPPKLAEGKRIICFRIRHLNDDYFCWAYTNHAAVFAVAEHLNLLSCEPVNGDGLPPEVTAARKKAEAAALRAKLARLEAEAGAPPAAPTGKSKKGGAA